MLPDELCDCSFSDNENSDNYFSDIENDHEDIILNIKEDTKFIYDDIFNMETDIFTYNIFTNFYIINKYKECIELDKNFGLNSNMYYIEFIKSLPWTKKLDAILDSYTSCYELMENHFRKKPDRPNIIFDSVPIKYNRIYYVYILWSTEGCVNCEKDKEKRCSVYNKIYKFLEKKYVI